MDAENRSTRIFLDFEASALHDSYPIEVGWAVLSFDRALDEIDLALEAHLIRPDPTWLAGDFVWSVVAEGLHGISREDLAKQGKSAKWVVKRLTKAIGGNIVYSDSPTYEQEWLNVLATAAGSWPIPIRLADINFSLRRFKKAYTWTKVGASENSFWNYNARAQEIVQPTHRVLPDLLHLTAVWLLAEGVDEFQVREIIAGARITKK